MRHIILTICCLFWIPSLHADASIDTLQGVTQGELIDLSEDLAAALSYKPLMPGEAQGLLGFDIGIAATATDLGSDGVWAKVNSGDADDYLYTTRLQAHKGLPFGFDIGASYAQVANGNQNVWGVEGRYAFLEGTALTPALALRAAYTEMHGVDVMDFATQSVDLSLSKGFLLLKPYGGVGYVWSQTELKIDSDLRDVDTNQFKAFAGLQMKILLLTGVLEWDTTGGQNTVGLKLGARF